MMPPDLVAPAALRGLGWALLHSLWQGALIAGLLMVVLALLRRRSPQLRYLASCTALAAMLLLPILTFGTAPDPASLPPSRAQTAAAWLPTPTPDITGAVPLPATDEALRAPSGSASPDVRLGAAPALVSPSARRFTTLERMLPWLAGLWAAGVLILSLRLIGQYVYTRRLRARHSHPETGPWSERLRVLARKLGIHRPIALLESERVDSPAALGILRPVIILPASALTGFSAAQVDAILAHELAHIRRHDYLVNLLQAFAETLLFYHPAAWWISKRIREERESCCDDVAVAACGSPVAYARALTTLEERRARGPELAVAATGGSLMNRIHRILGVPVDRHGTAPWFAGVLVLAAMLLLAALVTLPQVTRAQEGDSHPDERDFTQSRMLRESSISRSLSGTRGPDGELIVDHTIFDFMSSREYATGGLPPGFDLAASGIASESGEPFPGGRQFVYVDAVAFPAPDRSDGSFTDSPYLIPEGRAWEPFRAEADRFADRLHVVLMAPETEYARQIRGTRFPTSHAELGSQPGVEAVRGPWHLWLDVAGAVQQASAPDYAGVRPETRSYRPFYACVEDGRVVSSYSDILIATRSDRLPSLMERCLESGAGQPTAALPYLSGGVAPELVLQAEGGSTLSLGDLAGAPFAVYALSTSGEEDPLLDPARQLEAAEELLGRLDMQVPIHVLALPHGDRGAAEVAADLRARLSVPVYEDVQGTFADAFSNYLQVTYPLLVFDASGGPVDAFFPWRISGLPEFPRPFTLESVLGDHGIE